MSEDQSARLGLPYLAAGQMQKHVTLNEALTRLDGLVQTVVVSRTISEPPADPADGALFILPSGFSGAAWSGFAAGDLIRAEGGGWSRIPAPDGLLAFVSDAGHFVVRDGDAWAPVGARLGSVGPLDRLGLGTTADAANPFAARLNKALWTALETGSGGDGDLRLTLNKEGGADVLSLLFQSGYGGRAELGLIGSDDLTLKVSPDGGTWREAFAVDRTTGRVLFDKGAGRRETTVFPADGSWTPPDWARTIEAVVIGAGGGGGAGAFGASASRYGGGGGGAGGVSHAVWPADRIVGELTVVVGAGGAGGSASAGQAGEDSGVHLGSTALLIAGGGEGGGLGSAAAGAAGDGGAGMPGSNAGGTSSIAAAGSPGRSRDRPDAPGGGGAGGGLDSMGAPYAGGAGGDGGVLVVRASGGAAGGAGPGSAGEAAPLPDLHWAGGGGGGGAASSAGAGHAGASGGAAGGGGGGGGAGVTAGGNGGAGAAGLVWLTAAG